MMKRATASSFSRGGMLLRVDLVDRRQEQRPALDEELVQHLLLGLEVVVDEAVGDARLVGDVRDAASVEALAGEDADRGLEDLAAAIDRAVPWPSDADRLRRGQRYASARRLASDGSVRAHLDLLVEIELGAAKPSPVGRRPASTCPQGSTIIECP